MKFWANWAAQALIAVAWTPAFFCQIFSYCTKFISVSTFLNVGIEQVRPRAPVNPLWLIRLRLLARSYQSKQMVGIREEEENICRRAGIETAPTSDKIAEIMLQDYKTHISWPGSTLKGVTSLSLRALVFDKYIAEFSVHTWWIPVLIWGKQVISQQNYFDLQTCTFQNDIKMG